MNTRNTTAKEQMLKKVRQALLQKRENPYPDFEDNVLYRDEEESLDVTFARELTAIGGNFVYCDGEITLVENLIALVEDLNVTKVYVWEPGIQNLLTSYGFPIIKQREDFEGAEVGITSCEALIARTGSVLLSNGNHSGRKLSIYPTIHVVFAKASQIVSDIKHGLSLVKERYNKELPSMISLVTGPSRTDAVESLQVLGGHGSKGLYVFLIEDRF